MVHTHKRFGRSDNTVLEKLTFVAMLSLPMLFWNCVWSGAELRALSTAQHAEIFTEIFQNILLLICNEIG